MAEENQRWFVNNRKQVDYRQWFGRRAELREFCAGENDLCYNFRWSFLVDRS
jgi:hypothetical protein